MSFDVVNKPKHYNLGKVECIDAIESAVTDLKGIEAVCTANAIKYLWRAGLKMDADKSSVQKEIEDCEKAIWYIKRHIECLKK